MTDSPLLPPLDLSTLKAGDIVVISCDGTSDMYQFKVTQQFDSGPQGVLLMEEADAFFNVQLLGMMSHHLGTSGFMRALVPNILAVNGDQLVVLITEDGERYTLMMLKPEEYSVK